LLEYAYKCRELSNYYMEECGGTGMDSTVPTNTMQVPVPNTTGTVTDSGSVNTGFIGAIS